MYDVGTYYDLTHLNEQPSQSFGSMASANMDTEVEVGTSYRFVWLSGAV